MIYIIFWFYKVIYFCIINLKKTNIMKNLRATLIMILSLTFFYSCDENMVEDEVSNTTQKELILDELDSNDAKLVFRTQEELTLDEIKSNEFDFNEAELSVFGKNPLFYKSGAIEYDEISKFIVKSSDYKKQYKGLKQEINDFKMFNLEIFGPYDIYASPTKIYSNRKLIIIGVEGLASGIYFCDVYNFPISVQIPNGSIGRVNSAIPVGYINFTTQERGFMQGFAITPSGTFIKANTYYLYVKYNILGQQINKQLPENGQTVKFNYEYINW